MTDRKFTTACASRAGWSLLLVLCVAGCESVWGGLTRPHGDPCGAGATCATAVVSAAPQVDLLFVIDNSPFMQPKQQALIQSVPALLQRLDALGASYHIGLTTSDVGNWPAGGSFAADPYDCGSEKGDDGLLQVLPCSARPAFQGSAESIALCQRYCPDSQYVPTDGARYLWRQGGSSNVPDNAVDKAFGCLALLGATGCEIEGQLEAARRALDGHLQQNQGFLRPAPLGVILVTDEDDCSVAAAQRAQNDPQGATNCPGQVDPAASCFNPDYRCLARNLTCAEPLTQVGPKTGCAERPSSYLEPLQTYVDFLHGVHGADQLLLLGLWPPSLNAGGRLTVGVDAGQDPAQTYSLNRLFTSNPSCISTGYTPTLLGRPQLRLSRLVAQVKNGREVDVCAPDKYSAALAQAGGDLVARSVRCLPLAPLLIDGRPACLVGDVPDANAQVDGAGLPLCSDACCAAFQGAAFPSPADPAVAVACAAEPQVPCYCAPASTQPGVCAGGVVAGIWRTAPAARPWTRFTCRTG